MLNNPKITARQLMMLVTLFTIGSTILVVPAGLAVHAKQDAWIPVILGTVVGLLLVLLYIKVANLYPKLNLVEMNEKVFGKWLGTIVTIISIGSSFIGSAALVYVGQFVTSYIMVETPIEYILVLFCIIIMFGLRLGLTTIARAAEISFPIFTFLFILLIFLVVPQAKVHNIQPVFNTGIKPIVHATFLFVSFSGLPLIFINMFFPSAVIQSKEASKAFIKGTLLGGAFLLIIVGLSILVLGPENTARQSYPSYALARKINIANIITNIEAIMAVMWFISIYFKLALYFYATVVGLGQILRVQDHRILIFPLGLLLIFLCLIMYPNSIYEATWDTETWPLYILTTGLIVPLLLWIVAVIRKTLL